MSVPMMCLPWPGAAFYYHRDDNSYVTVAGEDGREECVQCSNCPDTAELMTTHCTSRSAWQTWSHGKSRSGLPFRKKLPCPNDLQLLQVKQSLCQQTSALVFTF